MNNNRNVAVFIDAENLFKGYGKPKSLTSRWTRSSTSLEAAAAREAGAGTIALARAFADWGALGLEDYRRDVERAGVETVQVFSVGKAEKNAADIVLVVDALRAAADLDQLEVFILVSADGDFVPLVRRLHEPDKYVIGATLADHPVNSLLEREVDQYVPLKVKPVPPAAALQPIFSASPTADPKALKASSPRRTPDKAPERSQEPKADRPVAKRAKEPVKERAKEPAKEAAKKAPKLTWHEMARDIAVVHDQPASSPAEYKAIIEKILLDSKVRSFCDKLANAGGTLPILAMAIKAAAPKISPSDARVSSDVAGAEVRPGRHAVRAGAGER
ncbi:NYN domain-containing protein [Aeromicrobium sp. UC242_57]|uniref:NYN domain-containing protein n=1 Tax=Aeromicrobium sp. UC242_57 TaxID=3374624 RepID=UPI0037BC51A5